MFSAFIPKTNKYNPISHLDIVTQTVFKSVRTFEDEKGEEIICSSFFPLQQINQGLEMGRALGLLGKLFIWPPFLYHKGDQRKSRT